MTRIKVINEHNAGEIKMNTDCWAQLNKAEKIKIILCTHKFDVVKGLKGIFALNAMIMR